MLNDYIKSVLIGIFVTAACISVIMMLLFLRPKVGDNGQVIHARFSNIDKISIGTRVTFAGRPIGQVAAIREVRDAKDHRTGRGGNVYAYELDLLIDSGAKVYKNDILSTKTSGLLGDKSVSITPVAAKAGESLIEVTPTDILFSEDSPSVDELMQIVKDLGGKAEDTLEAIAEAARKLSDDAFWNDIYGTAKNANEITGALNQQEELKAIIDNASNTMLALANVSERVEKGEGTVGKLVSSDELYLRMKGLFGKGEILFNDINHYGLLFQHDKGWQRLRARRLNLMQRLSTPQEFQNFFQDELDQISTSLSRVSMVLKESEDFRCMVLPEFTIVYRSLLDRVEDMEEALKLYNQEVMESCKCR